MAFVETRSISSGGFFLTMGLQELGLLGRVIEWVEISLLLCSWTLQSNWISVLPALCRLRNPFKYNPLTLLVPEVRFMTNKSGVILNDIVKLFSSGSQNSHLQPSAAGEHRRGFLPLPGQ